GQLREQHRLLLHADVVPPQRGGGRSPVTRRRAGRGGRADPRGPQAGRHHRRRPAPPASPRLTTDVAIVGGGPAGTAAALTLCRYAARGAVVLERGDYSEPRVGEALGPGARPLLDYLGIERMIEAAGHRRAHALAAAWGGGEVLTLDFLLTGRGEGWHLDRNRFDRSLADAAREAGAVVLTRARVAAARRVGNRWRIQAVDVDGQEQEIDVGFLIDAGGRGA